MSKPTAPSTFLILRRVGGEWWARLALIALAVVVLGVIAGFRINVTPSLPIGLYRAVGDSAAVHRGAVVIVCLSKVWNRFALQRSILGRGTCDGGSYGIGKLVLALEGDVVELRQESLLINGTSIPFDGTREHDRFDRRMPHYSWGKHLLGPGEIWLFSPHPAAFDSRYFGPVSVSHVRSVVQPIWTAGHP